MVLRASFLVRLARQAGNKLSTPKASTGTSAEENAANRMRYMDFSKVEKKPYFYENLEQKAPQPHFSYDH
jgi:hypothetical protein